MSAIPHDELARRLDDRVLRRLAALRRRVRAYVLLDGLTRLAASLVLAALIQLILDRWLKLSVDQRAFVNVVITLVWLAVAYRRILVPMSARLSDAALAAAVDRANPEAVDQISSAVEFAGLRGRASEARSAQLVDRVVEEACAAADRVEFNRALNHRHARRRGWEVGVLVAGAAAAFLIAPEAMGTWFRRNWLVQDIPWPQATYLRLDGFDARGERRAPLGDEFVVHARNEGRVVPPRAALSWWTADGRRGRDSMLLVGGENWRSSLGLLTGDVSFRIDAGDERTRVYTVRAVERPQVVETRVEIEAPAYTGLAPTTLEQQTVIEAPQGSRVRIAALLNKPVVRAELRSAEGAAAAAESPTPRRVSATLDAPTSGTYWFDLADADDLEDVRPVRFLLRILPDVAPSITLATPGVGEMITPDAVIPLELTALDSYGLGAVEVSAQRNEDPAAPLDVSGFAPGDRELRAELRFALAPAGFQAGDRLRLAGRATDQAPDKPNTATTSPLELRVVTPQELRAALADREAQLRGEFERMISAARTQRESMDRLFDALPEGGPPDGSTRQRLSGLERQQELQAARVDALAEAFEAILRQLEINQSLRAAEARRLQDSVIDPLRDLARRGMPRVADGLRQLRDDADPATQDETLDAHAENVRQMRSVLSNMLEAEGFREIIALVQEILGAQTEVHEHTVEALESELDALLGLDNESPPGDKPNP